MLSDFISLAIFDMAGTTVRDQSEVEKRVACQPPTH
jgi:hypothetical protein